MSVDRSTKPKSAIPVITAYSRHEAYSKSVDHSETDPDFDVKQFRKHAQKAYKNSLKYDENKPVEKYTRKSDCFVKCFRKLCCCCRGKTSSIHIHHNRFREQAGDEVSVIEGINSRNASKTSIIGQNLKVRATYEATNIGKKHKR